MLYQDLQNLIKIEDAEINKISKQIISFKTDNLSPVLNPTCVILGGTPGSGKSELEKIAFIELNRNAAICNVDDLKTYHPYAQEIMREFPDEYSKITGPFAHQCNLNLRNHCISKSLNFILETTFSSGTNINIILNNLKANNYNAEISLIAVPAIMSKLGIISRYEDSINIGKNARKVSFINHNEIYDKIPIAIKEVQNKKLYNTISVYGRSQFNYNLANESNLYLIVKSKKDILEDFLIERDQPLIQINKNEISSKIDEIQSSMIYRDASQEELNDFTSEFNLPAIKNNNQIKL